MPRRPAKPPLRDPDPKPGKFEYRSEAVPVQTDEPDCAALLAQVEAMKYDRDRAMEEFWIVVKLGLAWKQLAPVVNAIKNRADLHALAAAKRVELTGKDGAPISMRLEEWSEDQLKAFILANGHALPDANDETCH